MSGVDDGRQIAVPQKGVRKTKGKDRAGNATIRESILLKLRACTGCNILMTEDQFMTDGCPNCPNLELDSNRDKILTHTTPYFRGLVTILKPEVSWVAEHNKLKSVIPGAYAVSTSGGQYKY